MTPAAGHGWLFLIVVGAVLSLGITLWLTIAYGADNPPIWFAVLAAAALALCGMPLALGCRQIARLGHPSWAWAFMIGCCPIILAAPIVPGAAGFLVALLLALTLGCAVCAGALALAGWKRHTSQPLGKL